MNEDKKIVFFDLDGTLLNHDKTVLDTTRHALEVLQKKGVYTVISTGRAPMMFDWLLDDLSFDSYVSMNGQHAVVHGEEIFSNSIDRRVIKKLTELAAAKGHGLTYATFETFIANAENHPYIERCSAGLRIPYPVIDPAVYASRDVNQVQIYCERHETEEYMNLFKDFSFVRWHKHSVDMLPSGASKAVGVQKVLEHLNIPSENSYAFGDGTNDFEMLAAVGTGIAMDNAVPKLKETADWVTDSCANDGILKGLLHVGLLERSELPRFAAL